MEFGCQFEDDFFEETIKRKREIVKPEDYKVKVLKPFWYMEPTAGDDNPQEAMNILRLKANLNYLKKDYAKAVEEYSQCLELVPLNNNTYKRDILENIARSFLKLGDVQKALEWSLKLDESSINEDQKVVSMNLLAQVCHRLGKFKEELEALHTCMHAHKNYPEFWLRLGLCYAGLFKIDLPGYSVPPKPDKEQTETEPCCAFNLKHRSSFQSDDQKSLSTDLIASVESASQSTVSVENGACSNLSELESITSKCDFCSLGIQIVSSCLIRTKTLIESAKSSHFTLDRNEETKEKISNCLKHMEVDQSFIEIATKMLGTDFLTLSEVCDSFSQANFSQ